MTGARVDIGDGFFTSFVIDNGVDPAGIIIWRVEPRLPSHVPYDPENGPDPEHIWAAHGICMFDLPGVGGAVKWELHSLEPLHLEPSIQMYTLNGRTKSFHGWIRNGKWVSAG